MLKKLSTIPVLAFFLLNDPVRAIAQQAQPPAAPQPQPGYWPGPWHMWGNDWPHWWMGPMMMVLFAIFCIVVMSLMMGGGMMHWHRRDHALDLLKERCARGEINQAEYEEKRRLLQG